MRNISKQRPNLHKPFIRFIWISTKLLKIKRNPWIIYNQEKGLKPLNRRLAEKKYSGLCLSRTKKRREVGAKTTRKWASSCPAWQGFSPNRTFASLYFFLWLLFSSGFGGREEIWEPQFATMWGKGVKNMGFIDFCKRRTRDKHFQEILVSRDACTVVFFFFNSTLHAWENHVRLSLETFKTGQFWKKLRKMCAWILSLPFLLYFSSYL